MASDLIERLRQFNPWAETDWPEVARKAADALAAQAAEIERLKANHAAEVKDLCNTANANFNVMLKEHERADTLAARVAELEEALRQIEDWEPATQEITLAHQMADLARAALHPKAPAPAGEGGAS